MKLRSMWLLAAPVALLPASLAGQALPLAGELQVNVYTTDYQQQPDVASPGDGSYVVVWSSYGEDGSNDGIFGRQANTTGGFPSGEFPVNTYTTGAQDRPAVAFVPGGGFVVVWVSASQDGDQDGIFGQRYDASGTAVGSEFQVNSYTTGEQYGPAVAAKGDGGFVVVWTSIGQDGSDEGVFGQRFDSSGLKQGPEFQINTYTTDRQFLPDVRMDALGRFVVVWNSRYQDGSSLGVFGQRFDASGSKLGPEFQINTYTTGTQAEKRSLAMDRNGNFVVAWTDYSGRDGNGFGVFAQRFNSSAEKLGGDFQVNTYTTNYQAYPSVAMNSSGDFVIVWQSYGQDGSGEGVFGQRYERSGQPIGPEFPINATTAGHQGGPRIAGLGSSFVIVWDSQYQDGSGGTVVARQQSFIAQSMAVDVHSNGSTSSDVNGVLEPGEAVQVEPKWTSRILASVTGAASSFMGPAGGIYLLNDAAADYGIFFGTTNDCYDNGASHDCYTVSIGGTRPSVHWDASFVETLSIGPTPQGGQLWKLHIGDSFSDVPRSQPFYKKIETVLHNGITSGCGGTKYCPNDPVGRDQMSIFIAKGIAGAGELVPTTGYLLGSPYNCSSGGTSLFSDVSPTDTFCKHVHYLAVQNVTLGCAVGKYCPGDVVTRDAMASFIAKAIVAPGGGAAVPETYGPDPVTGFSYSCNPGTPNTHFTDVPVSNPFCKHIHYLWAKGVVSGCSATTYCPTDPVSRDAMAKFIANGFGLQLYGP